MFPCVEGYCFGGWGAFVVCWLWFLWERAVHHLRCLPVPQTRIAPVGRSVPAACVRTLSVAMPRLAPTENSAQAVDAKAANKTTLVVRATFVRAVFARSHRAMTVLPVRMAKSVTAVVASSVQRTASVVWARSATKRRVRKGVAKVKIAPTIRSVTPQPLLV